MTAAVQPRWVGYDLIEHVGSIAVYGLPVAQGSIQSLGRGRPSIHSNAATLKPWREKVQGALMEVVLPSAARRGFRCPMLGPVGFELTFTMKKPLSAPKRRRTFPITRPDLDKLVRSVLDAATASGVIRDDSQVIEIATRKAYPDEHPMALRSPGARLDIYSIT